MPLRILAITFSGFHGFKKSFEDAKREIRSRKSKKDKQYNVQKKKDNGSDKIPKGKSETIIRRMADKTMTKIKMTTGQTMIYKKLKIDQHELH